MMIAHVESHYPQLRSRSMDRLAEMLKFLDEDPDDSFTRYAVALEYSSLGDSKKAASLLEELRRRDAEYLPAYYQLGRIYSEEGEIARAEEAFRAGMELARSVGDLHTRAELEAALDDLDTLR